MPWAGVIYTYTQHVYDILLYQYTINFSIGIVLYNQCWAPSMLTVLSSSSTHQFLVSFRKRNFEMADFKFKYMESYSSSGPVVHGAIRSEFESNGHGYIHYTVVIELTIRDCLRFELYPF